MISRFLRLTAFLLVCAISFFGNSQITTDTLVPLRDAHIYSRIPATNYGTLATSEIYVPASGHYRYLADFDVNSLGIPSNAVITNAVLRLSPTGIGEGGAGTSSFILQAITSSWTETGVTYATQPTTTSSNQVTASALSGTKRQFDVTLLVQNLISGTQTFSGFRIQRNNETVSVSQCQYHSLQAASSGLHPKLVIKWYVPYSITAATITQATTLTANNGSVSPTISGGSGSNIYRWIDSDGDTIASTLNLTNQPYGWYGLIVKGVNGDKFYMAFLIGVKCEIVKIDFRQDPNFIDDSHVRGLIGAMNNNYGTNVLLQAGGAGGMYSTNHIFLRYRMWFDPNNYFYKAIETLKGNGTSAISCTLNSVSADWIESIITWNNQPGINATTPATVSVPLLVVATDPQVMDLTAYYRFWTSNPNYGYRISGTATGYQGYHSSDYGTVASRPIVSMWIDDNTCDRQSHVSFKPVLDGSMVLGYKGKLKVQFTEEYQQEPGRKWPIRLYDYNRQFIAGINYDGSQVAPSNPPLLPALDYVFGDNRTTLNLSSYSLTDGGYYMLELTKSTGEKEYVEFIYKN